MNFTGSHFPYAWLPLVVVTLVQGLMTSPAGAQAARTQDDEITLTIIQMNDVYEIAPLEGGKAGGLARVAALRAEERNRDTNTITVLSGDFLSPSAIGTSTERGKRINGAHMVEALNTLGLDLVTFGNHEFDIGEEPLLERINESKFTWIASNIRHKPKGMDTPRPFHKTVDGKPYPFPEYHVLSVKNSAGKVLRIGIVGLSIGSNQPSFIEWENPLLSARRVVDEIRANVDLVIALTHLPIDEDRQLARQVPELRLILGGHEHTHVNVNEGQTLITKADANARTVFIHHLTYSLTSRTLHVSSTLQPIDPSILEDPGTAKVVNAWMVRAYEGFQEKGFHPAEVVTTLTEPLDGRETTMRYRQTNLGTVIAQAMRQASGRVDAAFLNSGSVRLDDELRGTITQFDIIRTLPFGGSIVEAEIRGGMLTRVLDAGIRRKGGGAFPQMVNIAFDSTSHGWLLGGQPLERETWYRCAVSDYLISGHEQTLEFFTKDADGVRLMPPVETPGQNTLLTDIRLAVISYLKTR